jgi:hypothetical protein
MITPADIARAIEAMNLQQAQHDTIVVIEMRTYVVITRHTVMGKVKTFYEPVYEDNKKMRKDKKW